MTNDQDPTVTGDHEDVDAPEELTRAQKAQLAQAAFMALPTATKVKTVVATALTLVGAAFVVRGGVKVVRAGVRRVRR